jgi:RimJ/RimL family protein N-acetyltransferase
MFYDEGEFVGSALIQYEFELEQVHLRVIDVNESARKLYEQLGFDYVQTMDFVKLDREDR